MRASLRWVLLLCYVLASCALPAAPAPTARATVVPSAIAPHPAPTAALLPSPPPTVLPTPTIAKPPPSPSVLAARTPGPSPTPRAITTSEAPVETALWPTFVSNALGFSLQYPPEWNAREEQQTAYFFSPERFGSGPEPLMYYVYVSEYNNPQRIPFVDVATAPWNDDVRRTFTYIPKTIGLYRVYETTSIPSRSGALSVFFEAEKRYLAVALTPYDVQSPWLGQDKYVRLFRAMLQTIRLTR